MSSDSTNMITSSTSNANVNAFPSGDYIVIPCADGQRVLSKGFRFSPLDLELAKHYLKNKAFGQPVPCEIILQKHDLYSCDPDKLGISEFGYAKRDEAYFFTYKSEKKGTSFYTNSGYWEEIREEPIYDDGIVIAYKVMRTFYEGKSPYGRKTNYVLKEYRLNSSSLSSEDSIVKHNIENLLLCKVQLRSPKVELDEKMIEETDESSDEEE